MRSAMRSRLEPFKQFVRTLRAYLDGILAWTKQRVSNGAVEGTNNKIKSISHRSFGFRTAENFIAAIYHCCPSNANYTLGTGAIGIEDNPHSRLWRT